MFSITEKMVKAGATPSYDDGFTNGYRDGEKGNPCRKFEAWNSPQAQGYSIGYSEGNFRRQKKLKAETA